MFERLKLSYAPENQKKTKPHRMIMRFPTDFKSLHNLSVYRLCRYAAPAYVSPRMHPILPAMRGKEVRWFMEGLKISQKKAFVRAKPGMATSILRITGVFGHRGFGFPAI